MNIPENLIYFIFGISLINAVYYILKKALGTYYTFIEYKTTSELWENKYKYLLEIYTSSLKTSSTGLFYYARASSWAGTCIVGDGMQVETNPDGSVYSVAPGHTAYVALKDLDSSVREFYKSLGGVDVSITDFIVNKD